MAENISPNVQLDDISPEDITISKVQGKHELPFSFPGSGTNEECPFLTPEPKIASLKHDCPSCSSEIFLTSGSGSSDASTKEGSPSIYSSSSSDAESGIYDQHANGSRNLHPKVIIDFEVDSNAMEDNLQSVKEEAEGLLEETKDVHHEELSEKVANFEAELELTKQKVQCSQEEIARLKYENLALVEELSKTKEKLRISEESRSRMEQELRNEFEEHRHHFQDQLDMANQSIDRLQAELGSERRLIAELQKTINNITTNDLNNYGREVEKLKLALHDAIEDFSKDISLFQHEITSLNQEKFDLELRHELLGEQMKQYEIEKTEARKLQETRETELLKSLDTQNLKYDMLMAERDEIFAKMQTLAAELMLQMEDQITKLSSEHMELLTESKKTKKIVEDLRESVLTQEKEMEKQRAIIYDSANEKREAIRQLCFSLEYYRNEYHELRHVFSKYKQPAIMAA